MPCEHLGLVISLAFFAVVITELTEDTMDCQAFPFHNQQNVVFEDARDSVVAPERVTSGVKQPLWFGLSARMTQAREAGDLHRVQLSEMAGLAVTAARQIEASEIRPNVETVERLASALGVSPTWLAFGFDGFEPWRERIPRKGEVERLPPKPDPAVRSFSESFRGMPERLRLALDTSGLSMRALARAAELSPQTIKLIADGRSVPLISNVEAIAKALSVSPGWLAFGEIDEGE